MGDDDYDPPSVIRKLKGLDDGSARRHWEHHRASWKRRAPADADETPRADREARQAGTGDAS